MRSARIASAPGREGDRNVRRAVFSGRLRAHLEQLLTTKDLAEAIGASESSLRRWTDSGAIKTARTPGGHRRIPRGEAIRFIRETRATVVRPEILGLAGWEESSEAAG